MQQSPKKKPSKSLPMGFAEQVMDLEIKLQEEESLELIQILIQMYQIAVEFYLDTDIKKAKYFQNKLNRLAVKSLNAPSVDEAPPKREIMARKINAEMKRYTECQKTYLKTMVQNAEKSQRKIEQVVRADLTKQQQKIRGRMLKRVKSECRL